MTDSMSSDDTSKRSNSTTRPRRFKRKKILKETLFGKLYRGIDVHTREPVAIKESSTHLSKTKQSLKGSVVLEDIEQEIETLQYLWKTSEEQCSNIIRFIDTYERKKRTYVVFELLETDLFDYVVTRGDGESCGGFEDETREQMRQILTAMDFLHSKFICHRDISLENLMFDMDGQIKLIDFGVCVGGPFSAHAKGNWVHSDPSIVGKRQYAAPEMFDGGNYDARLAESWSAGVVFFTLLTGMPPFREPSYSEKKFELIMGGEIEYVIEYFGFHFSKDCIDLLKKLLCPETDRITAREALQHPFFDQ